MDHPADRWRQRRHCPDRHDHCHPLTRRGAPGWTVVQPGAAPRAAEILFQDQSAPCRRAHPDPVACHGACQHGPHA
jgi:hypothetical protein